MQKCLIFCLCFGSVMAVLFAGERRTVTRYLESSPAEKITVSLQKDFTSGGGVSEYYSDPEGEITKLKYDFDGNLVSLTDPLSQDFKFSYSSGGKILSEPDSYGGFYEYNYNSGLLDSSFGSSGKVYYHYFPDGRLKSFINSCGEKTEISYDTEGNIYSVIAPGVSTFYHYDQNGQVTAKITGLEDSYETAEYYEKYYYSKDFRKITRDFGGLYKIDYDLDAFGNIVKITDGKNNSINFSYDSKGRLICKTDSYGNETRYSYNVFEKISRIIFADGSSVNYEYDVSGNCVKISDEAGVFWQGIYDFNKNLISEIGRAAAEKKYFYDKTGRLIREETCGTITAEYEYKNYGRDLVFLDGKKNKWFFSKDEFGRPVFEKSPLGYTKINEYGIDGNLNRSGSGSDFIDGIKIDEDETLYESSKGGKIKRVKYPDGSSVLYEYNMNGKLTRASNEFSDYRFVYNKAGLLEKYTDYKSGSSVSYFYDQAGNRIGLKSDDRDLSYEYGKNGELCLVRDNVNNIKISFEYDCLMRETKRTLGNGSEISKNYDKSGRISSIVQKDSNGKLLWAQGYVYNNDGRLYGKVDNTGAITLYEYDKMGRVSKVKYPAKKEVLEKQKKEAELFGLYIFDSDSGAQNEYLDSKDLMLFKNVPQEFGFGQDSVISTLQFFSPESYSYDLCGNLVSKKNSYGEILYGYDAENHLKYITVNGQIVVDFQQDKNGNLISETYKNKKVVYSYTPENRMIFCHEIDTEELTSTSKSFAYDALGRRILSNENEGQTVRTFYDGLSFDIIKEGPVYENGNFSSVNGYVSSISTDDGAGGRYRFVSDSETAEKTRSKIEADYKKILNTENFVNFPLFANGQVCAEVQDKDALYFSSDYLGSVTCLSDRYGNNSGTQDFDVFGTPVTFSEKTAFGYAGKPYDSLTGTYNFGFRDYSPFSGSFTTSDPIRDGTNWFSYCNGDPVNFVDLWGLKITDVNSTTHQDDSTEFLGESEETISKVGCVFTSYVRMAQELGADISLKDANELAIENKLFHNVNLLTTEAGAQLVNLILREKNINNVRIQFDSRVVKDSNEEYVEELQKRNSESVYYFVTGRIKTDNYDHTKQYEHTLNVNSKIFETDNGLAITYNDTSTANRKSSADTSRLNEIKNLSFFTVHVVDPYSFDEVDLKTKRIYIKNK